MTRFTHLVLRLAGGVCSASDRATILEPFIADWQQEYEEARSRSVVRAAFVIARGTIAFGTTMMICANPFRGVEGAPARRFALAILGFAVAAAVIQSAPFQTLTLRWTIFRTDVYLNFPRFLADGIVLAMLPAAILTAGRLRYPRLAIVMALALVIAFIASNVIAPRTERIQRERWGMEFWSRVLPPEQVQARLQRMAQSEEEWRRRPDPTGVRVREENLERHRDGALTILALAFGLLGTTIGRSRVSAGSSPRGAVAVSWWFFVWMAYQLLQFVANRLRVVLPAPAEVAIWIPPLVFLAIAIAAELRFRATDKTRGGAEAPPLRA